MGSALKYSNVSKYYDPDCRFNGVFSRNNLPWIKDGANVIDLEDRKCKAKNIEFHYFLIKIQLYTLILLGLSIFFKKH